jgi:ketosteroid isomerase-like protein
VRLNRRGLLSLVSASCLVSIGAAAAAVDVTADRSAVDKAHQGFLAAMRANDCTALLRQLADDAVFVPPNEPNAAGKTAIRAWCEAAFRDAKTAAVTVSDRGVTVAADWAIEHGKFDWSLAPVAGGGVVHVQGSFVAIWHRQPDGSWKMTRDIWNSSQPAAR